MKIIDQIKQVQNHYPSAFNGLLAAGFFVGALVSGVLVSWLG